jgi:hypothetical protein
MPENEEAAPIPAAEAQQEAAQASDAKAEAAGTASDELSEDDLEAVAGGILGHPLVYELHKLHYTQKNYLKY